MKKNEKKTTLAPALVVKGKKGKKKEAFEPWGLEPTPSLDGDGYGWWH